MDMISLIILKWPSYWPEESVIDKLEDVFANSGFATTRLMVVRGKYYVEVNLRTVENFIYYLAGYGIIAETQRIPKPMKFDDYDTTELPDEESTSRQADGYTYISSKYKQDYQDSCKARNAKCALCNEAIVYPTPAQWAEKKRRHDARMAKIRAHQELNDDDYTDVSKWFTVDHIVPVKVWEKAFIKKNNTFLKHRAPYSEPKPSKEEAKDFFNNQENWQPMHWACNSRKKDDPHLSPEAQKWLAENLEPMEFTAPILRTAPTAPVAPKLKRDDEQIHDEWLAERLAPDAQERWQERVQSTVPVEFREPTPISPVAQTPPVAPIVFRANRHRRGNMSLRNRFRHETDSSDEDTEWEDKL